MYIGYSRFLSQSYFMGSVVTAHLCLDIRNLCIHVCGGQTYWLTSSNVLHLSVFYLTGVDDQQTPPCFFLPSCDYKCAPAPGFCIVLGILELVLWKSFQTEPHPQLCTDLASQMLELKGFTTMSGSLPNFDMTYYVFKVNLSPNLFQLENRFYITF